MGDDLETIEVGGGVDSPGELRTRAGLRWRETAPLSRQARRARRRAVGGVVATAGLLTGLAVAAYASWAVATVQRIDGLVADASSLDSRIRETEAAWDGRLLPDEGAVRVALWADLDRAAQRLRDLADRIERIPRPPDTKVAAYQRVAGAVVRTAAGGRGRAGTSGDGRADSSRAGRVDTGGAGATGAGGTAVAGTGTVGVPPGLIDDPALVEARRAVAGRWPLLPGRPAPSGTGPVLSAGVRARLPDPSVLFDGECGCRLRAVTVTGLDRELAGVEIDLTALPHRLRREPVQPAGEAPSDPRSAGARFTFDGDGFRVPLRNGASFTLPLDAGYPMVNDDAVILGYPGAGEGITLISLEDGRTQPVGGPDDRVVAIASHHLFVMTAGSRRLVQVDTSSLGRGQPPTTSWTTPADTTWVVDVALSPSGDAVAFAGVGRGGWGVAVIDGTGSRWLAWGDERFGQLLDDMTWSADGRWVFWLQNQLPSGQGPFRWIRGAPADGSRPPSTVRARGRYRSLTADPR